MLDFLVLDVSEKVRRIALLDRFGRYHVAHVPASLPSVGVELRGTTPGAQAQALTASSGGDEYRMTFEAIDCGESATYERLRPWLTR